MQTTQTLQRKIESAQDLSSVVKTMKALAAVSIRQYERAVDSLNEYNKTIEMVLQIVIKELPDVFLNSKMNTQNEIGLIIFGSEQGMVGQFNDQLASFYKDELKNRELDDHSKSFIVIGERILFKLNKKEDIETTIKYPSSLEGLVDVLDDILVKIEEWRNKRNINQIILFHHQPLSGSTYRPQAVDLFPLNISRLRKLQEKQWPQRCIPLYRTSAEQMFSSIIRQHIRISLYRAFVDSLASENASRLASMQAAEKNIDNHLDELNKQYQQQRQSSITSELLDIIAGYETLST